MVLYEVDVTQTLLALSVQLQHLDEALRGLLDQADVELQVEQLDTAFEAVEYLVDVENNALLALGLHNVVEEPQQVMQNVKHYFQGPLLAVFCHRRYQLVRVLEDV